ncbi:ABC transporterintegral membrane type 1 [Penicillium lividum]|nr:ABC transporterintegral membrane type 1 [Penicillium lividum]
MDARVLFESLELFHSCGLLLISIFAACSFAMLFKPKRAFTGLAPLQAPVDLGHSEQKQENSRAVKRLFAGLYSLLFATCLTEEYFALRAILQIPGDEGHVSLTIISKLSIFILYATELIVLIYNDSRPTVAHFSCWLIAIPIEIATSKAFQSTKILVTTNPNEATGDGSCFSGFIGTTAGSLISEAVRQRDQRVGASNADSSINAECIQSHKQSKRAERVKIVNLQQKKDITKRTPSAGWQKCFASYRALLPYMWPSESRHLQLVACLCFALMGFQRIVNTLIPSQTEAMFAKLLDVSNNSYRDILRYIIYIWLQGEKGLLRSLHSILWDHVRRHCSMQLSIATFKHVHYLSLDFHLGKQNEEFLSAMRDGEAITVFLELMTFRIIPTFVDFGIAMGCFWVLCDKYTSLMLGVLIFGYIGLTAHLAKGERKVQRRTVVAYREESSIKNASLKSYETVKYYNAEDYEAERYYNAVEKRQDAESQYSRYRHLSETYQLAFFMASFLAICLMTAHRVSQGHLSLNFAAGVSQSVQTFLVNSENTLELLRQQPTVMDSPQATPLTTCRGEIRLENAVNGVSFNCPAGSTTALVGESGQGKSTIFRLLFRFYNLQDGCIFIDGQNVQDISIDSLRRQIGVVPQDTVLFNETVMYNLKYANQEATDEDVYEACRAASIHDIILGFPDGYATWVGERGLCLSGGERQRVALARTILKKAKIILLDEATASLDTNTEEHVQNSLAILGRDRTILVIAHRLSTVTGADSILVFHDGQVVERGTHRELIKLRGRYASMWSKQTIEEPEREFKGRHEMETKAQM